MKYLIDSDVLINCTKAYKNELSFLEKEYTISTISTVTYGEVLQGSKSKADLKRLEFFLSLFSPILIEESTQELAFELLRQFHLRSGLMFLDALIAATALQNNLILVTKNYRHYKDLPNLKIKRL